MTGILAACCVFLCSCGKEVPAAIRVGSLKGPTSMGLLFLMEEEAGKTNKNYEFTMATQADELLAGMVKGDLDIALVPANAAANLYQKMNGEVAVLDINTLGVLYMVSGDTSVQSLADLQGRTIVLTGRGTTPDYVLQYLMAENGITQEEYRLEYKSEATEVAAILASDPKAIGLLPQPFVTAACMQNESLEIVLDLNTEWEKLQTEGGSRMVTGVTLVRKAVLKEQEEAVKAFLEAHAGSTEAINQDPVKGAGLAVKAGILAGEAMGIKAIPACNITCIRGEEMKQALCGYLQVLWEQDPASIGGKMPEEDFYLIR